jgi:hypothetical protein
MIHTAGYRGTACRVDEHEESHGFCLVCGGVWPCWRAARVAIPRQRSAPHRLSDLG